MTDETTVEEATHYCPGCGARFHFPTFCEGRPEAPHPKIEVVSTDELKPTDEHENGDPANHTPAPNTGT